MRLFLIVGNLHFKVKVTPENESSVDSNEVTVEYDSEGRTNQNTLKKKKVNDCINKIKVKRLMTEKPRLLKFMPMMIKK